VRALNFRKTTPRTLFTITFGSVGRRRLIQDFFNRSKSIKERFNMQMIRRAHQGWRNKRFGSIQALKIRLKYGRRPPTPKFRR